MRRDHVDFILEQWAREKPEIDGRPMGVVGRISRISRHFDELLQENFDQFGLKAGDFDVLATLRRSGAPYQLTPTQLYNAAMLSSGAMSLRLERLERKGLVERRPNPEDRRGVLVSLTVEGLKRIEEAFPAHVATEAEMITALSQKEKDQLTTLLRKLLLAVENRY